MDKYQKEASEALLEKQIHNMLLEYTIGYITGKPEQSMPRWIIGHIRGWDSEPIEGPLGPYHINPLKKQDPR